MFFHGHVYRTKARFIEAVYLFPSSKATAKIELYMVAPLDLAMGYCKTSIHKQFPCKDRNYDRHF